MSTLATLKVNLRSEAEIKIQEIFHRGISNQSIGHSKISPNLNRNQVRVERNFSGSSIRVVIEGDKFVEQEFGTLKLAARPWATDLQKKLKPQLRAAIASCLSLKF